MSLWILDDRKPVKATSTLQWALFMKSGDRIVAKTIVGLNEVSTVFLGLDHGWSPHGPALFFETLVFPKCEYMRRCTTWEQAEKQHEQVVASLRAVLTQNVEAKNGD
jgi:hypothetical protein